MIDDKVPEGLGAVKVLHPRLQSKADAKRVLALCAVVPAAYKGFDTAEGFILEADYQKTDAIWKGVLDSDPGRPTLATMPNLTGCLT